MPENISKARWLYNTASTAIGNAIDAESGRQLNQFEVAASRVRFDFFNALAQDQNTSGYLDKLQDELFVTYDELAENLKNPFIKQKISDFLDKKKEADRQTAIELSQKNAVTFGAQELITGLEDRIGRGKGADETYLSSGVKGQPGYVPSYQEKVEGDIAGRVAKAYAAGIINPDQASELMRTYTQRFRVGFSRDMTFDALTTLMDSGISTSDALDLLEKVVRSEGGTIEGIDMEGVSPESVAKLNILVQAKANVVLSPEAQEGLVGDLRREATAITSRRETQEKENIEFNDLELSKLWGTEEGRREMMSNGFAKLYEVFDAATPEGRTQIAKWQKDLGEWDFKAKEATKQEDAKRKWDIEIQRILTEKDISAIDSTISEIQNDKAILDAERDSMVSNLNLMKSNLQKEGVVANEEGVEFDPEPVRAEYDAKILAVTLDAINGVSGVATKITNLAKEIEQHPYFKGNEQDRNERTSKLMTLLKDLGSKAVGTVNAKSNIADMFSDPAYSEQEIRDAIRKAELADEITGDEANTLYGRLDTRAEVHLGDQNAKGAIATVNRYFYSRVNVADIEPEEAALLAQEQMTADNALNDLIDSKEYRAMTKVQQKEQIDLIMKDILDPVITRSFAKQVLGLAGLGGDEKRPDKYSQFQTIDSPAYANSLQKEIEAEWTTQLKADYPNINTDKIQAKRTLVDGKYIIELRHGPSGALLTQIGGKWHVKWPGDANYTEVKNRVFGEDTVKRLEALSE